MLNVIFFILAIILNLFLAKIDGNKIIKNIPINHIFNAIIYIVLLGLTYLAINDWYLTVGLLLLRIPIFNTALNYFRGQNLDYISNTTTSIIDKVTNFIPKMIGYWPYHYIIFLISIVLSFLIK